MTREEALNAITAFVENYACGSDLDGLREAIEALKERPHGEWETESAIDYLTEIGWLPEHDRILTERPQDKWEYIKEHITELRDANGNATQYGTCQFILNLMNVIEREGEAE